MQNLKTDQSWKEINKTILSEFSALVWTEIWATVPRNQWKSVQTQTEIATQVSTQFATRGIVPGILELITHENVE